MGIFTGDIVDTIVNDNTDQWEYSSLPVSVDASGAIRVSLKDILNNLESGNRLEIIDLTSDEKKRLISFLENGLERAARQAKNENR